MTSTEHIDLKIDGVNQQVIKSFHSKKDSIMLIDFKIVFIDDSEKDSGVIAGIFKISNKNNEISDSRLVINTRIIDTPIQDIDIVLVRTKDVISLCATGTFGCVLKVNGIINSITQQIKEQIK